MKKVVVGFAFSEDCKWVLLVKKIRPEWQRGFWNGVGGAIETDESEYEAMVREFSEETGLITRAYDWERTVVMEVLDAGTIVFVFRTTISNSALFRVSGKENDVGEKLSLFSTECQSTGDWIPNLRWLIPLQNQPLVFPIKVTEKKKGGFGI